MLPRELREKAFALYCADVAPNRITTLLKISNKDSVYRWRDKYNWEAKRKELYTLQEGNREVSEREQDLKIVESVLAMYSKAIKENQSEMLKKMNYKDVMEAVKLRRLLKGESTENINVNNEVQSVKEEVRKILEGDDE